MDDERLERMEQDILELKGQIKKNFAFILAILMDTALILVMLIFFMVFNFAGHIKVLVAR